MRRVEDVYVADYPADLVPLDTLSRETCVNRSGQKKGRIRRAIATLDIETTTEPIESEGGLISYIYQWQMCIDGTVIFGRTAETLMSFLRELADSLGGDRMLCFIHNMGYEWQFLAQYFDRDLILGKSLFINSRKPLFCRTESGLEFRDSFRLTNMGLEAFSKGCPHEKRKEQFNYRQIRRPWTPLTPEEESYCLRDALGLWEALERKMRSAGDNPATIPLTMTGYTRRYIKHELRQASRYHAHLKDWKLTKPAFEVAHECARGGNTHANRLHSGDILHHLGSVDIQSSYPSQIMLKDYPMGKPFTYGAIVTSGDQLDAIIEENYMFFGRFLITGVKIKNRHPIPDIPLSKCLRPARKPALDNGRILASDEIYISMTSIDWQIFKDIYSYEEIYGTDIWLSLLKPLPRVLRDAVFAKFSDKCILKYRGTNTPDEKRAYDLSKVVVNGIFGMLFMNPVRDEIVFDPADMTYQEAPSKWPEMTEEAFAKLQYNYPWSYLWGLWTSALGRLQLHAAIKLVGYDNVVYCDTDSIKFVGGTVPEGIKRFNEEITSRAEELGYVAEVDGVRFVPGIWEDESDGAPYLYEEFRTLGAKKYAYTLKDGSFHITMSGVAKEEGVQAIQERAEKEGIRPIEAFEKGAYIEDAGGFKATYLYAPIRDIILEGRRIPAASCIIAEPRDYSISLTSDYESLVRFVHTMEDDALTEF